MEKEFVPYELAVKLKELGMEFESLGFYLDEKLHLFQDNDTTSFMPFEIESPLWQQAFDFFRCNFRLHYTISNNGNSNCWFFTKFGNKYNTYQEARLQCLIKLIELCEK